MTFDIKKKTKKNKKNKKKTYKITHKVNDILRSIAILVII